MMALPWPAKPNDTSFTPSYSVGLRVLVSGSITKTLTSGLTIVGRLGPYTSASKMPTLAPICARVYAKFTATVDFPTPAHVSVRIENYTSRLTVHKMQDPSHYRLWMS